MIEISLARAEDLPAIASLAGEIWRACYPGIISAEQIDYMLAQMYDLDVLRAELAAGMTYLQACVDRGLRGFAAAGATANAHEFKLHKLYVHPHWQRQGIGSRLLAEVEKRALEKNADRLILNVNKKNPAVQAYEKNGFAIRKAVRVDIGGGFVMDDFVMEKRL